MESSEHIALLPDKAYIIRDYLNSIYEVLDGLAIKDQHCVGAAKNLASYLQDLQEEIIKNKSIDDLFKIIVLYGDECESNDEKNIKRSIAASLIAEMLSSKTTYSEKHLALFPHKKDCRKELMGYIYGKSTHKSDAIKAKPKGSNWLELAFKKQHTHIIRCVINLFSVNTDFALHRAVSISEIQKFFNELSLIDEEDAVKYYYTEEGQSSGFTFSIPYLPLFIPYFSRDKLATQYGGATFSDFMQNVLVRHLVAKYILPAHKKKKNDQKPKDLEENDKALEDLEGFVAFANGDSKLIFSIASSSKRQHEVHHGLISGIRNLFNITGGDIHMIYQHDITSTRAETYKLDHQSDCTHLNALYYNIKCTMSRVVCSVLTEIKFYQDKIAFGGDKIEEGFIHCIKLLYLTRWFNECSKQGLIKEDFPTEKNTKLKFDWVMLCKMLVAIFTSRVCLYGYNSSERITVNALEELSNVSIDPNSRKMLSAQLALNCYRKSDVLFILDNFTKIFSEDFYCMIDAADLIFFVSCSINITYSIISGEKCFIESSKSGSRNYQNQVKIKHFIQNHPDAFIDLVAKVSDHESKSESKSSFARKYIRNVKGIIKCNKYPLMRFFDVIKASFMAYKQQIQDINPQTADEIKDNEIQHLKILSRRRKNHRVHGSDPLGKEFYKYMFLLDPEQSKELLVCLHEKKENIQLAGPSGTNSGSLLKENQYKLYAEECSQNLHSIHEDKEEESVPSMAVDSVSVYETSQTTSCLI